MQTLNTEARRAWALPICSERSSAVMQLYLPAPSRLGAYLGAEEDSDAGRGWERMRPDTMTITRPEVGAWNWSHTRAHRGRRCYASE